MTNLLKVKFVFIYCVYDTSRIYGTLPSCQHGKAKMPFHFLTKEELISLRWRTDHLQRELTVFNYGNLL